MKKQTEEEFDYFTELERIQDTFGKRVFKRFVPKSEYPELVVTFPDELDTIELAPLYDVHVGSRELDEDLLDRQNSECVYVEWRRRFREQDSA